MARLSLLGYAACITIGVVAAVALLPVSSWSFRNQKSMLAAGARPTTEQWSGNVTRFPRFDISGWDRKRKEESLARSMALHQGWTPLEPIVDVAHFERPHLKALAEHIQAFPDDVGGIATFARILCQTPMISDARDIAKKRLPQESDDEIAKRINQKIEIAERLKLIVEKGKKLDPNNSFFPLIRAMTLNVLGRPKEARAELYETAKLRRYDDYATVEGNSLIKAVDRNAGYLGEEFRTIVYASTLFPHFASMKGIVEETRRICPPAEALNLQWALFQIQYTLAMESESLIGILVGRAGMRLSLARRDEFSSDEPDETLREIERKRFLVDKVEKMESALRAKNLLASSDKPMAMFEDVERLSEAGRTVVTHAEDPMFEAFFRKPFLASRILIMMAGLMVAVLAIRLWGLRKPEAYDRSRGTTALALIGVNLLIVLSADGENLLTPVLLLAFPVFVLAILQLTSVNLRPVYVAFLASPPLLVIPMGLQNGLAAAGIAMSAVGLAYFASRYPSVASFTAVISAIFIAITIRNPNLADLGYLQIFPATFLACALLMAFRGAWIEKSAAGLLVALTVAYSVVVVQDIQNNSTLKSFNAKFLHEADMARERAGMKKLSEE